MRRRRTRAAGSVDDLVADAEERQPLHHNDSKSGALFERVVLGGLPYVLKYVRRCDDWIMRATGDLVCRPVLVWEAGLLELLPDCIDPVIVGVGRDSAGGAILMRDIGSRLVPEGDHPLPIAQHLRFLDHMAQLHATFWGWQDDVGLTPLANRYLEFCPQIEQVEAEIGLDTSIPRLIGDGWRRFPQHAPAAAEIVLPLLDDPGPLLAALATTPQTLVHGDWKAGNLGSTEDGRTILLDWATPGAGPPCSDVAWYLALNSARLPHAKEDAIAAYRTSLERHGVAPGSWFDTQMALCLLGAVVQFGWEKTLGSDEELWWWEQRVIEAAAMLH